MGTFLVADKNRCLISATFFKFQVVAGRSYTRKETILPFYRIELNDIVIKRMRQLERVGILPMLLWLELKNQLT